MYTRVETQVNPIMSRHMLEISDQCIAIKEIQNSDQIGWCDAGTKGI